MLKKVRIKGISFKNNKETPKFAKKHSNVGANVERSVPMFLNFFMKFLLISRISCFLNIICSEKRAVTRILSQLLRFLLFC